MQSIVGKVSIYTWWYKNNTGRLLNPCLGSVNELFIFDSVINLWEEARTIEFYMSYVWLSGTNLARVFVFYFADDCCYVKI